MTCIIYISLMPRPMMCSPAYSGSLVADPSRHRYPGDQFYLKSAEEMQALFAHHPEAIENTIEIAKRCNVEFFLSRSS